MKTESRAVIYIRVSTEEQVEHGTSLDEQRAVCTRKAADLGTEVAGIFEECGVSGGLFEARPQLQAALKCIKDGQADTLIVYNLSRLSRDVEHQTAIRKMIGAAGARLVFCDMSFDDTATGNLTYTINGAFAQFERELIRERTSKGRRRRAEEGVQPSRSRSPYGYHIVTKQDVLIGSHSVKVLGSYQIVEEQARWVRLIFARYASGESLRTICRCLYERGVEPPRKGDYWRPSTLKRIMENPVYRGQAIYGKRQTVHDETRFQQGYKQPFMIREAPEEQWVYLPAPALVDEQVWALCQQRLGESRALYGGNPTRTHLLTGLLHCPKCLRGMRGHRRIRKRQNGTEYLEHQYHCKDARPSRNTGEHVCNPTYYDAQIAERTVTNALLTVARKPEFLQAALSAYRQRHSSGYSQEEYQRLVRELAALEARERATVEAQIAGVQAGANPAVYAAILTEISAKRTAIQEGLWTMEERQAQARCEQLEEEAEILEAMLQKLELVLSAEELTVREKHDLIAQVIKVIHPEGDGYRIELRPTGGQQTVANISTL